MRKRFPCGHVGKGQYCHFCDDRRKAREKEWLARKAEKDAVAQAIDVGLDMSGIPEQVAMKAAGIVRSIKSGTSYTEFRGKRLVEWDRNMIAVPVGWSHRLLCRDEGGRVVPVEVMSHEEYNGRISCARR